jgi:hypothetical protein
VSFKQKSTLVETKLKQISLPDYIRTDNTTIDFVISCLYEWITDKTKDFLHNNNTTTSIDSERYQQLGNDIDLDDLVSSDAPRGDKKLPGIDELQETAAERQYEVKVKDFFFGKGDNTNEV